ncbi:MAG: VCBS repeat-containing protein [Planctomycetota bacterium]|nr:VCBS repeat-containing protein [Planctomycetota bacterium]
MKTLRPTLVLAALALLAVPCALRAENLTLTAAPEDQTGLKAIMEKWKAEELQRQGGKFGDHGWWPWGLTAFDYDNDGDLDLLPTHHGAPGGRLLKNMLKETGKLTFVDVTKEVAGEGRNLPGADDRPWAWDFDGDGWLDLAGFSDESKARSLFNKEGKTFTVAEFTFSPISHATTVTDLNGDGAPDLLGHHRGSRHEFIFDASARSFKASPVTKAPQPGMDRLPAEVLALIEERKKDKKNRFLSVNCLLGHDLNGDGKEDLVLSITGAYGADIAGMYLVADADGKLTDQTEALGLSKDGAPILIQDLTGDGLADVMIASGAGAGLYVNEGKGKFAARAGDLKTFLTQKGPYMLRVWPADLDNDGDLDLVLSNPRMGQEEVYENTGGGNFVRVLKTNGWDANPIVICDIDNDGLLDVCIGAGDSIQLFLNKSAKPGKWAKIFPTMSKPNPYAVGAKVECFKAGEAEKEGARPFQREPAHPDATPVHAALGAQEALDVRVTFPGAAKPVVFKNVPAGKKAKVSPDGKIEFLD